MTLSGDSSDGVNLLTRVIAQAIRDGRSTYEPQVGYIEDTNAYGRLSLFIPLHGLRYPNGSYLTLTDVSAGQRVLVSWVGSNPVILGVLKDFTGSDNVSETDESPTTLTFSWPFAGKEGQQWMQTGYGFGDNGGKHAGIDIDQLPRDPQRYPAGQGHIARAVAAGQVIHVWSSWPQDDTTGYGNWVKIDHGIDSGGAAWETRYAHLGPGESDVFVIVGQMVIAHQPLGHVGTTGKATGPHLHLELRRDGIAVNPRSYLEEW